eukprot:g30970.t1
MGSQHVVGSVLEERGNSCLDTAKNRKKASHCWGKSALTTTVDTCCARREWNRTTSWCARCQWRAHGWQNPRTKVTASASAVSSASSRQTCIITCSIFFRTCFKAFVGLGCTHFVDADT